MLVLGRKQNQTVQIGDNIFITDTKISNGEVKLGIEAPQQVPIVRTELLSKKDS